MTSTARIGAWSLLAIVAGSSLAAAATPGACCGPSTVSMAICQAPLTKSYRIEPGFCPQQLVCLIPNCIPGGSDCCGPYGIPPIYAAGNYVLVRNSKENHELVAKFLTEMGAYVAVRPAQ